MSQTGYGPPPVPPAYSPAAGTAAVRAAAAAEKKPLWKKTWVRVVAAIFVIAVIGSAVNGGDKDRARLDARRHRLG